MIASIIPRVLAFFLVASAPAAHALDTLQVTSNDPFLESWAWTHFDQSSGLGRSVWNVFEDRDGHIWFATAAGARRYDGYRWTTYTTRDGLVHNSVYLTYQTQDGAMWFATIGGLSRFDGKEWTTYATADDEDSPWVSALCQKRDGILWAGFRRYRDSTAIHGGLSRFDGKKWTTIEVPVGPPRPGIRAILEASDGALWFATVDKGVLLRFDGAEWTRHTPAEGLPNDWPWFSQRSILESRDGMLWIALGQAGLGRFDGKEWTTYRPLKEEFHSLWQTEDGKIWAGGNGALARFDGQRWKVYPQEEVRFFFTGTISKSYI